MLYKALFALSMTTVLGQVSNAQPFECAAAKTVFTTFGCCPNSPDERPQWAGKSCLITISNATLGVQQHVWYDFAADGKTLHVMIEPNVEIPGFTFSIGTKT